LLKFGRNAATVKQTWIAGRKPATRITSLRATTSPPSTNVRVVTAGRGGGTPWQVKFHRDVAAVIEQHDLTDPIFAPTLEKLIEELECD
jgi:hypothetical protein